MNALEKFVSKPCVKRSIRTFFQAAAGYVVVNMATTDMTAKNAVKALIMSAIAAGISAAMNLNESEEGKNE